MEGEGGRDGPWMCVIALVLYSIGKLELVGWCFFVLFVGG